MRVCIVSGHPLATSYLADLLRSDSRWTVVMERNHQRELRANASVSVFVVDAGNIPVPLCECLTRIRAVENDARFVVLDHQSMEAGRLLNLRIQGFLTYEDVPRYLLKAVRAVVDNTTWVRPEVVQSYLDKVLVSHSGGFSNNDHSLTERELEILEFLKRRLSNAEIARHLGIRDSTVKFHISNLFSKLQVTSRRELLNREGAAELWNHLLFCSILPPS